MRRLLLGSVLAAAAVLAVAGAALAAGLAGGGPSERVTVPAPIDGVEVIVRESFPQQVALRITAGLPSGCAQRHSHSVSRSGDTFNVTVLNSMPSGDPICTMIYGTYELTVELGSEFAPGVTYTFQVNDKTTTLRF